MHTDANISGDTKARPYPEMLPIEPLERIICFTIRHDGLISTDLLMRLLIGMEVGSSIQTCSKTMEHWDKCAPSSVTLLQKYWQRMSLSRGQREVLDAERGRGR